MHKDPLDETPRRDLFELMALRTARLLGCLPAGVERFSDLPDEVQTWFNTMKYTELIRPLLTRDRAAGMSQRALSIRYGLSRQTIRTILARTQRVPRLEEAPQKAGAGQAKAAPVVPGTTTVRRLKKLRRSS